MITDNPYVSILLMALAIYVTRISGYWLASRVTFNKYVEAWLGYLPGCILISIVAPSLLTAKPLEWLAAALIIIMMWRSNNLLLAMVVGIGTVAVGRTLLHY